jgi:hypothetical protein
LRSLQRWANENLCTSGVGRREAPLSCRPPRHLRCRPLIQFHYSDLCIRVRPKAAPGPLFRRLYQSTRHRIAMHVPQLLDPLALAPHLKVVEPPLPDMLRLWTKQCPLSRLPPSPHSTQHPARKSLLDGLHHLRRIALLRFTDQ